VGPKNLTVFTLFWFFSGRGYREHIMPHQLESFKMAERTQMNTKRLVTAMIIAVIFGSIASFWATISELYRLGGAVTGAGGGIGPSIGHVTYIFQWLDTTLTYPKEMDIPAVGFMAGSMAFTFILMLMRMRFIWWPLHPAGYAISMTGGVGYFWSCLVISSTIKLIILRFGGVALYHKAVLFFFGVLLGEYCVGAFWSVLSVVIQQPIYDFAPG
ncbi:MAG: hypothetical protein NZ961_16395, partial [Candidatus Poribacteria bacterium]|nr:hypothetical protein [Candidatus Poribacteria bacterium]